jgi:hypothetical protein
MTRGYGREIVRTVELLMQRVRQGRRADYSQGLESRTSR